MTDVQSLQVTYIRALRSWQCNNLKECLLLCDNLTRTIKAIPEHDEHVSKIKQLLWFLKIRCLAENFHVNECLLLNEEEIESDKQVCPISRAKSGTKGHHGRREMTAQMCAMNRPQGSTVTSGPKLTRIMTGIISGRTPVTASHRITSRATTSYRPLTTNLTGTQTAFSRSTQPLLKYANDRCVSKLIYEYLYNTQSTTNKYPDYRQCLVYLNMATKRSGSLAPGDADLQIKNQSAKLYSVYWLKAFGVCYFNLNMNKEAEEYFLEALKLDRKHLDLYTWLIKIYLKIGRANAVLRVCQEADRNCRSALVCNWMARVQSLMGDMFTANANLRDSLRYFPTNIEALANVGYFAFYGGQPEVSLKCFERIYQLTESQTLKPVSDVDVSASCQLLNNLALSNFQCGNYHKVMPLFRRSFMAAGSSSWSSAALASSRQMTSDIWYNLSFVPLACGLVRLASGCLESALKSDSQHWEALNNLGVLKYGGLIDEHGVRFDNAFEKWSSEPQRLDKAKARHDRAAEMENSNEPQRKAHERSRRAFTGADESSREASFDQIESYFIISDVGPTEPEILHNKALVKRQRGQLLEAVKYCNLYLAEDPENYHVNELANEIKQLLLDDL